MEFLKEKGVDVNKTTVYRNLDRMTENGLLIKHKSMISDGFIYQVSKEENHCEDHIHFQCRKCGAIVHLSDEKTGEYLESISKELGLEIDFRNSSFNGLCKKCRMKK